MAAWERSSTSGKGSDVSRADPIVQRLFPHRFMLLHWAAFSGEKCSDSGWDCNRSGSRLVFRDIAKFELCRQNKPRAGERSVSEAMVAP